LNNDSLVVDVVTSEKLRGSSSRYIVALVDTVEHFLSRKIVQKAYSPHDVSFEREWTIPKLLECIFPSKKCKVRRQAQIKTDLN